MTSRLHFARWRSDVASGGNRYDDELSAALTEMGVDVVEHDVPGAWPAAAPQDQQRLVQLLARGSDWLVDNIVGSVVPDVLAAAIRGGTRITLLVHYFPGDDPALTTKERDRLQAAEMRAVGVASHVVVTSAWAARQIAVRYGRGDAVIAQPGVGPATIARGSLNLGDPPMLLWLSRVTAQKDPLTFVEALNRLHDLSWGARVVGPDNVDAALSQELHRRLVNARLDERVEVLGARNGDDLESIWSDTDLLVHTSKSETYGMVISEALARGIPSMVATGTGAVEAHRVGWAFQQEGSEQRSK